jgi:hypothetical protein
MQNPTLGQPRNGMARKLSVLGNSLAGVVAMDTTSISFSVLDLGDVSGSHLMLLTKL